MVYGGAALFFLLLAALIPLAFSSGAETTPERLNEGERGAIFADYWNGGKDSVEYELIEQPGRRSLESCQQRIDEILAQCAFDRSAADAESSGREYFLLSSGENQIRVCRMWQQNQGDWRNWVDFCFDMDTGDIYYFYLSSECMKNQSDYADAFPDELGTQFVIDYLAAGTDSRLLNMSWSGQQGDNAVAIYSVNGSAVIYEISCIYYKSTLIDIKIICA